MNFADIGKRWAGATFTRQTRNMLFLSADVAAHASGGTTY